MSFFLDFWKFLERDLLERWCWLRRATQMKCLLLRWIKDNRKSKADPTDVPMWCLGAEKRCHHSRWWCWMHNDRKANPCLGSKPSIPDQSVLLLPDQGQVGTDLIYPATTTALLTSSGYSLWWSMLMEEIWCSKFKELENSMKTELDFTVPKLYWPFSFYIAMELFIGEKENYLVRSEQE